MFRTLTKLGHNLTTIRYHNKNILTNVGYGFATNAAKTVPATHSDADHSDKDRKRTADAIAELKSIESNLFENGNRQRKPIDSRELLAKYTNSSPSLDDTRGHHQRHRNHKQSSSSDGNRFRRSSSASSQQQQQQPQQPPKPPKVKSSMVENTELGLTYTKLHLNDPWLNTLLLSVKSRKSRSLKHQLLIEGRRLIIEAIRAGLRLEHVLFSDVEQLAMLRDHLPAVAGGQTSLVKVPHSDLRLWSNLSTCPGLMAVFSRPADMETLWQHGGGGGADGERRTLPITVVCDQIREPNNVGSVIRNCAAAACQQVILAKGCADPWESKALRGGAGAQFKIPVRGPCEWSSVRSMLPEEHCFVYLAENSEANAVAGVRAASANAQAADAQTEEVEIGDAMRLYSDVAYGGGKHCVVVIGGETEGLSVDAYRLLRRNVLGNCVRIPLAGEVDSLNSGAALAVILFEIRKQLLAEEAAAATTRMVGV